MNEAGFMLMPINELFGRFFLIPSYQRGYRWEEQQVSDLLNDIKEFMEQSNGKGMYSIQPLVVKKRHPKELSSLNNEINQMLQTNNTIIDATKKDHVNYCYEVIDGQQRLTTIYLILKAFSEDEKYSVTYETRPKSQSFLQNVGYNTSQDTALDNIDFDHMWSTWQTVTTWYKSNSTIKDSFLTTLKERVCVIWYEDDSDNPVETFTRLNIGKIPLTNSELIKAMLLKESNGIHYGENKDFRLSQLQMATEWDNIEFTLQDDEFWGFLYDGEWRNPTKIDFIFELLIGYMKKDDDSPFVISDDIIGKDDYRTFRYFYEYMKQKDVSMPHSKIWAQIRYIFNIFNQWYNDIELYHYIGYIIHERWSTMKELLAMYQINETKKTFIDACKNIIKEKISNTVFLKNLNFIFEVPGHPKRQCEPILLLFNIQTIINQNNGYKSKKYQKNVFYKFPFHLYLSEKWNIEHIDSNTENPLNELNDQKEWLKNIYLGLKDSVDDNLKQEIIKYINQKQSNDSEFESLKQKLLLLLPNSERLTGTEKNCIWNFTLLDERTNKSYGNDIFPSKRRKIIGKDQGISVSIDDNLYINETQGEIAFIPPSTRNVFMKYYTPYSSDIMSWNRRDAIEYSNNLFKTLEQFGVQYPKQS